MRERLIQLLSRYFNIGDSYTYNLTRVKTAFDVGTVDLDDFEEYTEDNVADLADHLIENGVIVPTVLPERVVYRISGNQLTGEYNVYELRVGPEYISDSEISVFCHPICNGVILTSYEVFTSKDFGKTVFLTREDAEAALKAREKQ